MNLPQAWDATGNRILAIRSENADFIEAHPKAEARLEVRRQVC
jgi:hypothetical protein